MGKEEPSDSMATPRANISIRARDVSRDSTRKSQRDLCCLDEEYNGSDVLERIRRSLRLGACPHDLGRLRHITPENEHGHHHRYGNGHLAGRTRGRFRDLVVALNRSILTGMRRNGVVLVRIIATSGDALTACVPVALPLDPRPAVAIVADYQPAREDTVAQPEPNQEEPREHGMESAFEH